MLRASSVARSMSFEARGDRVGPNTSSSATRPPNKRRDAALELPFAGAVAILFRRTGDAERAAARDDGDFVNRVVLGDAQADDRVPDSW